MLVIIILVKILANIELAKVKSVRKNAQPQNEILCSKGAWGTSLNKRFWAMWIAKSIACHYVHPPKMARKNGGACFSLRILCFLSRFHRLDRGFYKLQFFLSRALSMASIRFLHSLPLFLDGSKY